MNTALFRPTVSDRVSGKFGDDRGAKHLGPRYHQGIDLAVPQGTPLYASGTGVVEHIGNTGNRHGYGRNVVIRYQVGDTVIRVRTAHMSREDVAVGRWVSLGTQIGLSGGRVGSDGAGGSGGPHVHVETAVAGALRDPNKYLNSRSAIAGGGVTPIPIEEEEDEDMAKPIYFIASDNTGLSVGVGREDVWVRSAPGEPLRRMTQGQWSEYQNNRTPLEGDIDYFWKTGAWFGLAFIEDNVVHGYNVNAHPWMNAQVAASVDVDALVAALDARQSDEDDTAVLAELAEVRAQLSSIPDAVRENLKNAL